MTNIRFCPKCKSTNITGVAGFKIGLFECVKCGFRSVIFPELEIKKKIKKRKKKK